MLVGLMYGMVNKAIRDLIVEGFGEPRWIEIADHVGVDHHFISMQGYDDKVTYDLVSRASELLDVPSDELLRQFGSYWIRFTASEGYGSLISLFGETLGEFLEHLGNDLHARVALTMPDLHPPEFHTEKLSETLFRVHYSSHRVGLKPMVHGVLEGLALRFDENVEVTHIESVKGEVVGEVFEIQILS
jgi:hypothetical protein